MSIQICRLHLLSRRYWLQNIIVSRLYGELPFFNWIYGVSITPERRESTVHSLHEVDMTDVLSPLQNGRTPGVFCLRLEAAGCWLLRARQLPVCPTYRVTPYGGSPVCLRIQTFGCRAHRGLVARRFYSRARASAFAGLLVWPPPPPRAFHHQTG